MKQKISEHLGRIIIILLVVFTVACVISGVIASKVNTECEKVTGTIFEGKQDTFSTYADVTVEIKGSLYELLGIKDVTKYYKEQTITMLTDGKKYYADEDAVKAFSTAGTVCRYTFMAIVVLLIIGVIRLSAYITSRSKQKK